MRSVWCAAFMFTSVTVTAVAHTGVENPVVLERMQNMKAMADQMEVLVPMARGETDFDANRVAAALEALQRLAMEVPARFRMPEMDPQSEALPEIWESFEDFEARSNELLDIARSAYSSQINDNRELIQVVRRIGSSCSSCHEGYRAEQ